MRTPMTKEAKIKRALGNGLSAAEIARRYRTSPQYVNLIRRRLEAKKAQEQHEHIVGPLPEAVSGPLFATGIVSLQPVPETPQPTAGIMAVPPGAGEIRELEGPPAPPAPPKPTLWQRFKLWAFGRA